MEYKILKNIDPAQLQDWVNEWLGRGWALYGDIVVVVCGCNPIYIQALIKSR